MSNSNLGKERELVLHALGPRMAAHIFSTLAPMLPETPRAVERVDRASFAAALNMLLFDNLLDRVPSSRAYIDDVISAGRTVCFDHGAVRTILFSGENTGELPGGENAIRRVLEPLGYQRAGEYPLPRLRMMGRAYRHRDFPESLPQFFVSELHVDAFDAPFADAARRVFGNSRDPLDDDACAVLARFSKEETIDFASAASVLPRIAAVFGRHHDRPMLRDYELLKQQSHEAAWIATEGNAFNHATDRVANVEALASEQRRLGRSIKDYVEVSTSGRVRQTAFRADVVNRHFGVEGEDDAILPVPGSFYELISRDRDPATGNLDLAFDSSNATGIFAMTKAA